MKRKESSLTSWWVDLGISKKTLLVQSLMIVLPLLICIYFLINSAYMDYVSHVAQTSYQYCRYTLDSIEANMMQIKSAGNVAGNSRMVQNVLSSETSASDSEQLTKLQHWLNSTLSGRQYIQSVRLYSTAGSCETAKRNYTLWPEAFPADRSGWHLQLKTPEEEASLFWQQNILKDEQVVGVLIIRVQPHFFSDVMSKLAATAGGNCYVFQTDTSIYVDELLSNQQLPIDPKLYQNLPEGYQLVNDKEYISVFHCSALNLSFLTCGGVELYANAFHAYFSKFCIIAGLLVLLFLLAAILNHYSITKRMKDLAEQIERQKEQLHALNVVETLPPIEIMGRDEIGQVAQNYNAMLGQLLESVRRERTAEQLQQTARFSALQAQIQPHFLYNTLESLRMMADESNAEDVAEMLFVLGKLMRGSISGREQEISLAREIENCVCYLKLSKLRFERLNFQLSCETDIQDIVCPRFILQPLVENSIQHGISHCRHNGEVSIRVYRENAMLLIDVQDNGAGISSERLEEIRHALATNEGLQQEHGGIGLCNVHQRLKMFYGENSGLEITSTPGQGTICRIRIVDERKLLEDERLTAVKI